ncbi:MAG: glycine cleavage system protein GcvH [Clostridiales bacterium]|jgi:glycine cleavage system H protein|nr:glycine cleavage system protein GcvH [Clostridiales bacterium]HHT07168.1 glycine cleavage system protein GcvH [Clostridiales bacterium]
MNIPKNLKYAATHEWLQVDGDKVTIGITDFAQKELGDLVFINLPNVDDEVAVDEAFADVESVKAVSDIISPINGVIYEVNEALMDAPELINEDAYAAWIVKVKDVTGLENLLDADQYADLISKEG